jgi:hypothetical protein
MLRRTWLLKGRGTAGRRWGRVTGVGRGSLLSNHPLHLTAGVELGEGFALPLARRR